MPPAISVTLVLSSVCFSSLPADLIRVELYRQLAAGVLDRLLFHVEDLVAVNLLLLVLHALGLVRHRHELLLVALCRFLPAVGIVRSPIPTAGRI